ncbi:MAG: hypothetical protein NTY64_09465 [Deltaproteobacteria bacterium]|nr:hypothetical protein [Deltaproteobacteria bacterium]
MELRRKLREMKADIKEKTSPAKKGGGGHRTTVILDSGFRRSDGLFDVQIQDNKILLMPVRIQPAGSALEAVREKMKKLGITQKDITEAIRWARSKKE